MLKTAELVLMARMNSADGLLPGEVRPPTPLVARITPDKILRAISTWMDVSTIEVRREHGELKEHERVAILDSVSFAMILGITGDLCYLAETTGRCAPRTTTPECAEKLRLRWTERLRSFEREMRHVSEVHEMHVATGRGADRVRVDERQKLARTLREKQEKSLLADGLRAVGFDDEEAQNSSRSARTRTTSIKSDESRAFLRWIVGRIEIVPGFPAGFERTSIPRGFSAAFVDLYGDYAAFCEMTKAPCWTGKRFAVEISKIGNLRHQKVTFSRGGERRVGWRGIRLRKQT